MKNENIIIGSRESTLAMIQSEMVRKFIQEKNPSLTVEILSMKTTGDRILDRTLDKIGGKGLFVKELDRALLEKKSHLSVHSLKDMPMEIPDELPILAYSRREDPRDALVLPEGVDALDPAKPIGCSSRRRALQLARLYPGMEIKSIRGNIQTRLRKLEEEGYAGLVLAAAGLKRLGLEGRIARYFSEEEILPAAGQGILAVQGRTGEDYSYLEGFSDPEASAAAIAERAFVRELDGGCSSPVAAFARIEGDTLYLKGMYEIPKKSPQGESSEGSGTCIFGTLSSDLAHAQETGIALARTLKEKGGSI